MSQATLPSLRSRAPSPPPSEAAELAEAVRTGGEPYQALTEGISYLWQRGLIRELGEVVNGIVGELERNESPARVRRLVFDLLTAATAEPRGGADADAVRWVYENSRELAAMIGQRLTPEQSARLGELWTSHEKNLNWVLYRHQKHGPEIISELGEVLSRPWVFGIIGPEYSEKSFKRLVRRCLHFIVLRHLYAEERDEKFFRRIKRTLPGFAPEDAQRNAMRAETEERLVDELAKMRPRHREAVAGYFLEERAHEQNAKRLGVHERTQRRWTIDGLAALRHRLPESVDPSFVVRMAGEQP